MNNKVIKLNYIKDINDPIKLEESVISYLKDYDLESLLKINKYGIEDILIKNISNNILLFDSEDNLLVLKKYNYKKLIIELERRYDTLKVASIVSIYNDDILELLTNKRQIHLLYLNLKDEYIIQYILSKKFNIDIYFDIRNFLDYEINYKFLDKLIDEYPINNVLSKRKEFDKNELKYICSKTLDKLTAEQASLFLELNLYNTRDEKQEQLVDIIANDGDPKVLYYTLINCISIITHEQYSKLELALEKTNDIQYNFYYQYHLDKTRLIAIMGGYLLTLKFIEKNILFFKNKKIFKNIYENIKQKANEENISKKLKMNEKKV